MRARFTTTCALLLVASMAYADVRDDVAAIAQLVQDNYFDATRANEIAAGLRERARAGKFDAFDQPQDLAQELTTYLRPFDGHFRVAHEPKAASADAGASAPRRRFEDESRRTSYGFRRVERLPGNIGLIELTEVAAIEFGNPNDPARRAADAALALMQGADAVVIDLRNNGGGAPSMVGYLVSAFVKPDANVYNVFHSREGTQSERPDVPYPQPNLDVPLFILTSARTGSAAEAIAFTLQSAGRARVVGERSGGAANPGDSFRTSRGYAVFVATGSPRNPLNGRNWEGEGVRPDIESAAASALDRACAAALSLALQNPKLTAQEKIDTQWAHEALTARAQPFTPQALDDFAATYGSYVVAVAGRGLTATLGRWPPMTLVPLSDTLFFDEQNPSRRFLFERENGKVAALRILRSSGSEQRLRRADR